MAKGSHYVNNEQFLKALVDYRKQVKAANKAGEEKPQVSNYIGECFIKIADHLSRAPNFNSYTFRDEMISDGIENCIQYVDNFNPSKSKNPFAYFTQIIYYAFVRRIMKEKKQLYVKYKSAEQSGILDENELLEDENGVKIKQFELYDNISEFIQTFEKSKAAKKKKLKKKRTSK
jgi:hypothetical protein